MTLQRLHDALFFNGRVGMALVVLLVSPLSGAPQKSSEPSKAALISEALSAAPPEIAKTAKVKNWDGTVLKEGSGAYSCYPTHPSQRHAKNRAPMCLDKTWEAWGDAWMNKKPFKADQVAIAYMLAGDAGASNVDPYAEGPTSTNQWVVEGPHTMVLVPDPAQLEAISTDMNNGGPYVMWKGTPYAHIMVPVGKRPAGKP
jgi:hypothetical protein